MSEYVSILIPIYNGIEYIYQAINSINKQTYTNYEVIIGVNGHNENSDIFKFASKFSDDKIRVIDLHFIKGKSNALNEMVKLCKYNWIALLDIDDIWLEDKLLIQMNYTNEYDVIGTYCQYFGDRNNSPKLPVGDISNFNFFEYNPIINSSALIKKELAYWDPSLNALEDYDLWLKLKKQGKKIYNVDCILTLHRIHNDSAFNSKDHGNLLNEIKNKYKKSI